MSSLNAAVGSPFGVHALPAAEFGTLYNASLSNVLPGDLRATLEVARQTGTRVVLTFTGAEKFIRDDYGFNFQLWHQRVDRYRGVDLTEYIEDGTIIGHFIMDEPSDPTNWNGFVVTPAQIDEMAQYSKSLWPTMPVIIRGWPAYLKGFEFQYLDAAWANYLDRFGNLDVFIANNVRDAEGNGLALVVGLNHLAGGSVSQGLTGYFSDKYSMSAGELLPWGSALLADPYPCAFIGWKYDVPYLSRLDIQAAMTTLAQQARERPYRSCRGAASDNPPPPPQANTTTTITGDSPDPSAQGAPITVSFTVTSPAGTPAGIVHITDGTGGACRGTVAVGNCILTPVGTGTLTLTARYQSTASFNTSAGTEPHTVNSNQPPVASFILPTCTAGAACQFADGSNDPDGTIVSRVWTFGDGTSSTGTNPTNTYATAGPYSVTLTVTDNGGATSSVTQSLTVNSPPTAAFTVATCVAGVPCQFTDGSGDSDGSIATRSWDFGDGRSSTLINPLVTYAAAGSYNVTLRVTDNLGATNSNSQNVVVAPAPGPTPIGLSLTSSVSNGSPQVRLNWSGASGLTVNVYRNGLLRQNTANDGRQTYAFPPGTTGTFVYKVCETATTRCSNPATLTLTATSIVLSVRAWIDGGRQTMTLTWSGASGATVDIYRNGAFLRNTPNDGRDTNGRNFQGPATYLLKVCQRGTATCSNTVTATFN